MKEIQYPTNEWIDEWIDKHPDSCIADAETAWWDKQIDRGNPTPYDLPPEKVKASKEITKTAKNREKPATPKDKPKRERKPNEEKREIIQTLFDGCSSKYADVTVTNIEKEICFTIGNNSYSVTLTCHRKAK